MSVVHEGGPQGMLGVPTVEQGETVSPVRGVTWVEWGTLRAKFDEATIGRLAFTRWHLSGRCPSAEK